MFTVNIADYCATEDKKSHSNDKTGNKDDLHLWKLQLLASSLSSQCQDSLNWRSRSVQPGSSFKTQVQHGVKWQ